MQKTQKYIEIPLSQKAKKILEKYIQKDVETIFKKRTNVSVNRDLKKIASLCKIKINLHFHLSRHTYATLISNSDANAFTVMQLLGHSDIRMSQRYVKTNINDLTKTLNKIDAFN